ncbi:hypothetical protein FJZ27_02250 [Candidatus Peribacteria bacterium]|nr:hypothetical protein [Candidatus Peribacteria bacterium]
MAMNQFGRVRVLQVQFVTNKPEEQLNHHFRLKSGESESAALERCLTRDAFAYRFYDKVEIASIISMLVASQDAENHSPWTFLMGTVLSFEQLRERQCSAAAIEFWQQRGRTKAIEIPGGLMVFVDDTAQFGPKVSLASP